MLYTENQLRQIVREELRELTSKRRKTFLSVEEAADYTGLAVKTLYTKTSQNQIPFHKPGGKLYFKPDELDAYISGEWQPAKKRK